MRKRTPQRRKAGFTIVEMLMTTLILLMVTAIVAAGVPVAINAYQKVLDAANAQLLLSTTISRLQEELSTAVEVWTDSSGTTTKIYYSHYKNSYKISLENVDISGTAATEIKLKYTAHTISGTTDETKKPKLPDDIKLVTGMTETSKFSAKFDSITYDSTNNVFLVNELKIIDAKTGAGTNVGRNELIIRPVKAPDVNPDYS